MKTLPATRIFLYTRYERFWHWLQALLIIGLLLTGFEVHGSFTLFGFDRAVRLHNVLGLTWLTAFFFFVFWVLTTGEWRQYIPTTQKMLQVVRYYAIGIFLGEKHPVQKSRDAKHNPLQRLVYLSITAVLLPLQMVTGFLYWTYNSWPSMGLAFLSLELLAVVHIIIAFNILSFVCVHVYMTTTGHTVFTHIKAMFTGWEAVEEGAVVEAWEKRTQ